MKRLLGWLQSRFSPKHRGMPTVRWLAPQENPFGIDILDCRVYATTTLSATNSPEIAARYCKLRDSTGEELRGKRPERARSLTCSLTYPMRNKPTEGPLFKAEQMEDKWDIYFYDGHLYFRRSWTGDLVFRAHIEFEEHKATVTTVDASSVDDDALALAQVDFLIKSHLLGLEVPHPLPKNLGKNPYTLAIYSLALFGRRGFYGTMTNTLELKSLAQD